MRLAQIITLFTFSTASLYSQTSTNVIDANGKKQGPWIITSGMANNPCGDASKKIKEGAYKNSRKEGLWIEYYCNDKLKSKINYIHNRPNGDAIFYHKNGNIKEQGAWKSNRWVGAYKLYYPNGQVRQAFNFNESGKREGKQAYYHENGQVQIVGNWSGGSESGEIKEYYANGELRSSKTFNGGTLDPSKTKTFEPKKPVPEPMQDPTLDEVVAPPAPIAVVSKEKVNVGKAFDGNGYWQLYNRNRQVSKVGEFKRNRLIDGKVYHYDENGLLERIAIYRKGKYIGDGIIEDEPKFNQ